jgi:hypothetical protein
MSGYLNEKGIVLGAGKSKNSAPVMRIQTLFLRWYSDSCVLSEQKEQKSKWILLVISRPLVRHYSHP